MEDNLVDIGEVIVHGVMFDPKNVEVWRNMDIAQNIYRSVPRLFELLEERRVNYVLVGGIAMLAYVEGRNTQDIDLIVDAADLAKLPEIRIEEQNSEFARGWFGDLRVDFLFANNKLFDAIRRHYATTKRFAERDVPCATVEGLLLMKLLAIPDKYRRGHFDRVELYEHDVRTLLRIYHPETAPLFHELAKHMLPSDVEEICKIVAEIEDRIARQAQCFGPARPVASVSAGTTPRLSRALRPSHLLSSAQPRNRLPHRRLALHVAIDVLFQDDGLVSLWQDHKCIRSIGHLVFIVFTDANAGLIT